MRARLIPVDGGPVIDLTKDMILVGRGEDCDARVDHKSVSKRHCVLVPTAGLILVRDLGSTNGTRVNGQRVRRGSLLPNDNLAIATFRYILRLDDTLPDASGPLRPSEAALDFDESNEVAALAEPDPTAPAVEVNRLPDRYANDDD